MPFTLSLSLSLSLCVCVCVCVCVSGVLLVVHAHEIFSLSGFCSSVFSLFALQHRVNVLDTTSVNIILLASMLSAQQQSPSKYSCMRMTTQPGHPSVETRIKY